MVPELEDVKQRLAELGIEAERVSESQIAIRAIASEVGDITVNAENGELTISIGTVFHHHYAADYETPLDVPALVEFIADFVNERSILTLWYSRSRVTTARVANVEPVAKPPLFTRRFQD
jgi:hypothetical protein